ncbi:methylmalonyl-CoA mutase family protein [Chloroflexota bacterium]
MGNEIEKIKEKRQEWEERALKPALERFGLKESPNKFYTPADVEDFDFLTKVGFPGEYPLTASTYPVYPYQAGTRGGGSIQSAPGLVRSGRYSGYGAPEDTRDYYKQMQSLGRESGPNLAFDLPTQIGLDSDSSLAQGEVGKVGVAVDTLRDFEVIYEAFKGPRDLDKIASNFTINAPANMVLAMYFALAEKRGIPIKALRGTPQNDVLKEYIARGTYIFPPRPALRMMRDLFTFCAKNTPQINITSIGGYHIRGAGSTREQDLGFAGAIGIEYLRVGTEAGIDIDNLAPRFSFNAFGGSMELLKEAAFQRAARRVWAKIVKERFGAKNPRSCLLRQPMGAHMGYENTTKVRPLNNLSRAIVGAIASAFSGSPPNVEPPYDESLGLGWSLEAMQLTEDAGRILQYEAKLTEVIDPLAGSYYVEHLTDEIESAAWKIIDKIESMGGAVAAIENGYMQREIASSAHERQKRIETGEDLIVGVNCFVGENELEVTTTRLVPNPYDPVKREEAEKKQIASLAEVKRVRDNRSVARLLAELESKAKEEDENLIPHLIECAKAYVTLQEMCDVAREVFGEYESATL